MNDIGSPPTGPYVEQLRALGVPESESRSLYRSGVTAEALRPWTAFGVTTALHWQLVTQARLSLDQARRWTAAGLDARFAAAGTALGADLAQVRDLVADYLDGTGHRADLDNAWTDLADSPDTNLGGRRPRRAEDLELAEMLALAPDERRELREGRHSVTWRFRPRPPGPGGY